MNTLVSNAFFPKPEVTFKDCQLGRLARELGPCASVEDLDNPVAKNADALERYANTLVKVEGSEANEGLFSSYKERIDQTPLEGPRGHWEGERGESKYFPNNERIKTILDRYSLDGIDYQNGIPDFSQCSECTVEIDNMSSKRQGKGGNFDQCDAKCAEKWNQEGREGRTDWTARDVENWRSENGYTWHERNDRKTCDLVPTEINDYFGHLGGVAECAKAEKTSMEDEFDD